MLLTLKNLGKIADAKIELNGITVIAGENNTGKSTIGKVLFCIFNSFYKINQQINTERGYTIERFLDNAYFYNTNRYTKRVDTRKIAEDILNNKDDFLSNEQLLHQFIIQSFVQSDPNFKKYTKNDSMDDVVEKVIQILNISDEEIFKTVLQKKLESEFNNQINNIYFPDESSEIKLKIKDKTVKVIVKNNEVQQIVNSFSLNTEIIYLDDPFALDDLNGYSTLFSTNNYGSHRAHLRKKLTMHNDSSIQNALNEIITTKKIDSIMEKINTVCSGEIVRDKRIDYGYKRKNSDAVLDVKNISTGLKTFVILKTLLANGNLEDNGTIVLDEPEIHLHPEWQLVFAELIVLIQKAFNMHILLNTHSPYFLHAIEVYSAKYNIADKCKYYMAENMDVKSNIVDVTANIEEIYQKLARPLQDLENERYSDD